MSATRWEPSRAVKVHNDFSRGYITREQFALLADANFWSALEQARTRTKGA